MKIIKKILLSIITLGMILYAPNCTYIKASSISISTNTSAVNPNGSFTVNVNIVGGGSGMFFFSGSNASLSTQSLYCDNSCSITATAGSSGTASVYVSTGQANTENEVTDLDNNVINYSSSVSVKINSINNNQPSNNPNGNTTPNTDPNPNGNSGDKNNEKDEEKPSKDSTSILASLTIDKGELTPKFSSTTTSYKVNLPAGTTELKVSAKAKDSKAKVEGTGNIKLNVGDNTIRIRCIAEDESVTEYTIQAHVSEKPITYVPYKNTKLGVLNEAAPVSKLFVETKIKVNGKEVTAWKNSTLKLTLLYMQNEKENTKELYIYDEVKKEATSIYKPFTYQGKNLIMIDVPEKLQKRDGMKFTTITLGEYKLPGWKFKDDKFKNYALLYVMDEKGNTLYYQYEKSEDSLQLYSQAAAIQQEDYQKYVANMEQQSKRYVFGLIGLAFVCLVLLIMVIVLFFKRRNHSKYKKVPVVNSALGAEAKSLLRDDD